MTATAPASSTLAVPWCRMANCYRPSETGAEFCRIHGWNQLSTASDWEPQARTLTQRSASSRPVAADGPTSRSAQLHHRLQAERIGCRKSWGLYVDLMLEVRRQVSRDVDRWVAEVRWMQERSTA